VRAPSPTIPAPPFPRGLTWINSAPLRMDKQKGRPVLVEFWDFCRINSLRTMPYLKAWHERYADAGLRVIGVHTGGFPPSRDEAEIRAAVQRLGVEYPVVIDMELEIWDFYGNEGWPGRYLWDAKGALFSMHYGEGAYAETEREIQALLGVERELLAPVRPEDAEGALLPAQTTDSTYLTFTAVALRPEASVRSGAELARADEQDAIRELDRLKDARTRLEARINVQKADIDALKSRSDLAKRDDRATDRADLELRRRRADADRKTLEEIKSLFDDQVGEMTAKRDWDLAAADIILSEAGGVVSDIHGRPLAYNNAHAVQPSLVAANAGLHAQIIGLLRQ